MTLTPLARDLLGRQTAGWTANALGMNRERLVELACQDGATYNPALDKVTFPPPPVLAPTDHAAAHIRPYLEHRSKRVQRAARRALHELAYIADLDKRIPHTPPRRNPSRPVSGIDPAAVRAWARAEGLPVGARGRLPDHIQNAYLNATQREAS